MNMELKLKIDNLRKEGLSYTKITHSLSCENLAITNRTVMNYSLSRIPKIKLPFTQQLQLLCDNKEKIAHYAKSASSNKDLYNKIASIDGCYNIVFATFSSWVCSLGGLSRIKHGVPGISSLVTGGFMAKLDIRVLNSNKELILTNINRPYQVICDMIQDKTDITITPHSLCSWCKINNIKKTQKTDMYNRRTVIKKLIDVELDIAFNKDK